MISISLKFIVVWYFFSNHLTGFCILIFCKDGYSALKFKRIIFLQHPFNLIPVICIITRERNKVENTGVNLNHEKHVE